MMLWFARRVSTSTCVLRDRGPCGRPDGRREAYGCAPTREVMLEPSCGCGRLRSGLRRERRPHVVVRVVQHDLAGLAGRGVHDDRTEQICGGRVLAHRHDDEHERVVGAAQTESIDHVVVEIDREVGKERLGGGNEESEVGIVERPHQAERAARHAPGLETEAPRKGKRRQASREVQRGELVDGRHRAGDSRKSASERGTTRYAVASAASYASNWVSRWTARVMRSTSSMTPATGSKSTGARV